MTVELDPDATQLLQKVSAALENGKHSFLEHDGRLISEGRVEAVSIIATAFKHARHEERMRFVHKPCRHTVAAAVEKPKRDDLHQWQTAQSEWFDDTILEIVGEYADWRDNGEKQSNFPPRDEWGMTDEDWRWVRWEGECEQLAHRWKALKAIWGKPVPARYPSQYVSNERARGDDWTPWRAICATVAIVLNRNWTDKVEQRWRARHGFAGGIDVAYWDARSVYGGYTGMICWLYPRCRISIFSDGETFM